MKLSRHGGGLFAVMVVSALSLVTAAPRPQDAPAETPAGEPPAPTGDPPSPTDVAASSGAVGSEGYEYKVEDAEKELYHGKEEKGHGTNRVEGKYYVLLPDKRLMTVTYYVDGESGFVPTITFEENANPFGAPPPAGRR